jgi:hypothetical protein
MNSRALYTGLSFGQLFLFKEMETRASTFHKNKTSPRRRITQPNLMRVALLGWLLGMTGAIIFQCLWG